MIKVVIDRTKWLRGKSGLCSRLLSPDEGKMCCLGFAAKTLGCKDEDILDVCYPADTKKLLTGLTDSGYGGVENTNFSIEAAKLNDKLEIAEPEREQQLTELAKNCGFEFVFVN